MHADWGNAQYRSSALQHARADARRDAPPDAANMIDGNALELFDPTLPGPYAGVRRELGDAEQVLLPMRDFGYSGHRAPPGDLSFVAYTTAHERMPRYGDETRDRMKAIVRPEAVTAVRVHGCRTRDGKTVDAAGRRIPESYRPALGTPVRLGNMRGRVVRHFQEGVAIEFANVLSKEGLQLLM